MALFFKNSKAYNNQALVFREAYLKLQSSEGMNTMKVRGEFMLWVQERVVIKRGFKRGFRPL